MAVTNPKRKDFFAYAGNTFRFLLTFTKESDGSDIDLAATYSDIQFRIFKSGQKSTPEIDKSVGAGGSNQLWRNLINTDIMNPSESRVIFAGGRSANQLLPTGR